jgi:hypothetical protein
MESFLKNRLMNCSSAVYAPLLTRLKTEVGIGILPIVRKSSQKARSSDGFFVMNNSMGSGHVLDFPYSFRSFFGVILLPFLLKCGSHYEIFKNPREKNYDILICSKSVNVFLTDTIICT